MSQLPDHKHDVFQGWWPLLDQLHEELITIRPDYEVAQVKEKWGLLRVYIDGTPIQVDAISPEGLYNFPIEDTATDDNWRVVQDIVNRYQEMSGHICEYCGAPGQLDRSGFWWKTMCPSCKADPEGRHNVLRESWHNRNL